MIIYKYISFSKRIPETAGHLENGRMVSEMPLGTSRSLGSSPSRNVYQVVENACSNIKIWKRKSTP